MQDGLDETTELGQPSRRLLATASTNQADVNFQFLAFTTANVQAVENELGNVIKNSTGTDNALPVSPTGPSASNHFTKMTLLVPPCLSAEICSRRFEVDIPPSRSSVACVQL